MLKQSSSTSGGLACLHLHHRCYLRTFPVHVFTGEFPVNNKSVSWPCFIITTSDYHCGCNVYPDRGESKAIEADDNTELSPVPGPCGYRSGLVGWLVVVLRHNQRYLSYKVTGQFSRFQILTCCRAPNAMGS